MRAAAIERLAQLDDDSALTLYRAARAADPDYFLAQHEYIALMRLRFRGPELRREYASDHSTSALHECLLAAVQQSPHVESPATRLRQLESRFGPSPCTDAFLLQVEADHSGRGTRAMRDSPQLPDIWGDAAGALGAAGRWQEADQVLRAGLAAVDDPIARVSLSLSRIGQHAARRDTPGALAIWQSLAAAVRRDGRPGVLAEYLAELCTNRHNLPVATPESRSAACRQLTALARAHRAWFAEWDMTRWHGQVLLDGAGELTAAAPILSRCVQLADSTGSAGLRLIAYTLRGRTLSKAGRLSLALRDLKQAVALGPAAEEPYYFAEAYHNLAHTYEGEGRFAEAASAADSFAAIAALMQGNSSRWMSRHDAGMIRWEGGWHAAAARDFDAMVRVVDEQHDGEYFAGEYFERAGDLGRALQYYRVGANGPGRDPRSLAALARVYEALGLPDSAEAVARRHDAESDRWSILEQPLLPNVLARQGHVGDAVSLAGAWARRQQTGGNIQGAAIAQLRLAELLLLDREPQAAHTAAASADSLSAVLHLTAEPIKARTLEGRALFADGQRSSGLVALRAAVDLARAHPSTDAVLSTNLALGNALEATRARTEALAAYDRAGAAVERMTAGLNEDPDRTSFKSLHMAPFDGALRILLGGAAPEANAVVALGWSARRKAAALALAGEPNAASARRLSIAHLRDRLRADEALIDFTMLDSTVAAIVVRRRSTTAFPLHVAPSTLARWVDAVRRPLVATPGGRVDIAHARFDAVAAESLFKALIAPLGSGLDGVRRLAIVPDGVLWYVPFAALVTGWPADATAARAPDYLVARYELRLLPSAAFLSDANGVRALSPGFRVEALTYSVPAGAAELAAIRTALGADRVRTREGGAATERAAMDASAAVLHLAAHGVVDDRDPLATHLRLAPGAGDDGLLHLSDVAGHRLVPQLVVLTACEAVSGKLYAGEGLVGLARAFLISGAREVIASEWPVDSSAVALTSVLYRELGHGSSPSAALRAAQLALLAAPATAHPIHWAGFVAFDGGSGRGRR